MKVVFMVSSLVAGGAERQTIELFLGLPALGIQTRLCFLKDQHQLLPSIPSERQGDVWCPGFQARWDGAGLWRLVKRLKAEAPDLVVAVNSYPLFYSHLARLLCGRQWSVEVVYHSTDLPPLEWRQFRWVYKHFFNRSHKIFYVCHAQRQHWELRGLRSSLGVVIHNGVDPALFDADTQIVAASAVSGQLKLDGAELVVGICAALRPEKRHGDLLEALALLRAKGLDVCALVIGDGPQRAVIEHDIQRLRLAGRVQLVGFQQDVRPYMVACDCLVIVSHSETFSLAVLEGMALGKPMVVSDIGGAREQIVDGVHGHVVHEGDVAGLAAALQSLMDPAGRRRMGLAARQRVGVEFTRDQMLRRYADEFLARVSSPARAAGL